MSNFKKIYIFLRTTCPQYILTNILLSTFKIFSSYINVLIIGCLLSRFGEVNSKNNFFIPILFFILFNLLSTLIGGYLNKKIKLKDVEINKQFDLKLSKIVSEMEYKKIELQSTQNAIHKIKDGKQKAGDFSSLIENFFNLLVSLIRVFIGTGLLLFYTLKNHIYIEHPILNYLLQPTSLIIILFSTIIVYGIFEKREQQNDFVFFEDFEPLIKKYHYYIKYFMDYERSKDIRVNNVENKFEKKLCSYFNEEEQQILMLYNKNKKLHFMKNLMYSFSISFVYLIASTLFFYNSIEIDAFYLLINCTMIIVQSSRNLFSSLWQVKYFSKYYNYFFDFENKSISQISNSNALDKLKTIEFQNVFFKYDNTEKFALKNINLLINSGENIAIVGENGSGKSTLIKLLLGLYTPDSGKILVNGTNIIDIKINDISSVIHQDFSLISASVLENIILTKDINKAKLFKVTQNAKIAQTLLYQNNSLLYKTYDIKGVLPSGGEEQKIALARMFYKEKSLLILDEPTAALDVFSEIEFYNSLLNKEKEKIKILISHRLVSCANCDRIIVLQKGQIVEDGTHKELINRNGIYRKMWDIENSMYYKTI